MKHFLFVCTGNSCRSVMAEGFFNQTARDKKIEARASSAGVSTLDGFPPTADTVSAMEEAGIDVSKHQSRRLTDEMVRAADRIFVMEGLHKDWVLRLLPEARDKVFLLSDFSPHAAERGTDIPDPIRLTPEFYRNVRSTIRDCVDRIIETLK